MSDVETYKNAFSREMYKCVLESYNDSLTPGSDETPKSKKPIMIGMDFFREISYLVECRLEQRGMKRPAGLKLEELAKLAYSSQGAQVQNNPSTPKIPPEMYDDFFRAFFGRVARNPYKDASKEEYERQFKSTHEHLATLYQRVRQGLKPDDFVFSEQGSEHKLKVIRNRYSRVALSMILLEVIRLAYEIKPETLEDILKATGVYQADLKQLESPSNYRIYASNMRNLVRNVFGSQNLGQSILAQVLQVKRIAKT